MRPCPADSAAESIGGIWLAIELKGFIVDGVSKEVEPDTPGKADEKSINNDINYKKKLQRPIRSY